MTGLELEQIYSRAFQNKGFVIVDRNRIDGFITIKHPTYDIQRTVFIDQNVPDIMAEAHVNNTADRVKGEFRDYIANTLRIRDREILDF